MNFTRFAIFAICSCNSLFSFSEESQAIDKRSLGVTPMFQCGRFGDRLINHMQAMWVAYRYQIPLLYSPFPYSDSLRLSLVHRPHKEFEPYVYTDSASVFEEAFSNQHLALQRTLYGVPLCAKYLGGGFGHELEDPQFMKILRDLIQPIQGIQPFPFPPNTISIALHIRSKNNGYDIKEDTENLISTRFLSYSYYLNAVCELLKHFASEQFYIHIFTDDPFPLQIRDQFSSAIRESGFSNNIAWGCREKGNHYDRNVLEDLFAMSQFDCIVRPDSNFSMAACILGGPLIEVCPCMRMDEQRQPIFDENHRAMIDNLFCYRTEHQGRRTHNQIFHVNRSFYYHKKSCQGHRIFAAKVLKRYGKKALEKRVQELENQYKNDPSIKNCKIMIESRYDNFIYVQFEHGNIDICDNILLEYLQT